VPRPLSPNNPSIYWYRVLDEDTKPIQIMLLLLVKSQ
jgi:hypothetical protein